MKRGDSVMVTNYDELIKAVQDSYRKGGDDMDIMDRVSRKLQVPLNRIKPVLLSISEKKAA